MEAVTALASPATLASHATANTRREVRRLVQLARRRRLRRAALVAIEASPYGLSHRRARLCLREGPCLVRLSSEGSWGCHRRERSSWDRRRVPGSGVQNHRGPVSGQESLLQPRSAAGCPDASTILHPRF